MALDKLIALDGPPPQVAPEEAVEVARALYGLSARAHRLEGERDCNFLLETAEGRQLVLKFIDRAVEDAIVDGQCAALMHLAEQAPELPVPAVVHTLEGTSVGQGQIRSGPCRVRLITYLHGDLVAGIKPGRSLLAVLGAQIARLDHGLRGFWHPALGQPLAWDLRRAPELSGALPLLGSATRRFVAGALESVPGLLRTLRGLRAQAIHNDCHPRNLLVDASRARCTGILDLGDMIHAPLIFEPAVAMAEFLNDAIVSVDDLAEFLCGYTQVQALEYTDIELLYPLIAARIALGVVIQALRARSPAGAKSGAGADCSDAGSAAVGQTHAAADLTRLSEMAACALDQLARRGPERLTAEWHQAAGTAMSRSACSTDRLPASGDLLGRRRRTLGAHAELSYERPLHPVRGEGVWLYTQQGERLLDVYNNVPHVGHAHPEVVAALAKQAGRIASNTRYLDERIVEYSERLLARLPSHLARCLFVNSGSEANDIAWRIAKFHTQQGGALVMKHAYHGITDAVTALSPAIALPVASHVEQLAVPRTAAEAEAQIQRALSRLRARGFAPAALLIDSMLTSSGIFDPAPDWIAPLCDAVRAAGGLIVADEVQCGFGRCGSHFWGFERRGVLPDLLTLGKPAANGYPLGVVVARASLLETFQQATGFFSTFGGNPVAAAAGLAVLQVLERERLVENARATGDYFLSRLRSLAAQHPALIEVRGSGLLLGAELAAPPGRSAAALARDIVNGLRERGVLIGCEGPGANVLKLRPPMPFRPEHVDFFLGALTAVLRDAGI